MGVSADRATRTARRQAHEWVGTPIDQFVLRSLEDSNLKPAPPADKATLIRRLYHDLVGMPPSPADVEDFVHDDDPLAWETQVDRLLADSRYGEHWARFWLDVVRYSESDGWKQDAWRPNIWRYRDYVVQALNDDKPWADFVREQIAGDVIASDRTGEDRVEALAAVGYLRLGIFEYNQRNAQAHWNDIQNDVTDVTSDVFLGMSLACCRCHDHKYDALPQSDYFRLKAFFEPVVWQDDIPAATAEQITAYRTQLAKWEEATQSIRQEIDALTQPYIDRKRKATVEKFPLDIQACFHKAPHARNSWEQQMAYLVDRQFYEEGGGPLALMNKADKQAHEALQKRLAEFESIRPEPLSNLMTVSSFAGPTAPTTIPGSGEEIAVSPGVPGVLEDATSPSSQWTPTAGRERPRHRIELADWITSLDNPLTTRVIVNRIWQQHFGRGIVDTPNDFGRLGSQPSHPELLDWLAASFIENGGSFKQLHRKILLSAVWKQSADHPDAEHCEAIDPAERLLWRAPVRRLTAEQIRDSMLFVSGELNDDVGGPSVDFDVPRRSIYVKQFRNATESFLRLFDSANGMRSVAVRDTTTTPVQSLLLLNGTWSLERAKTLASRLQSAAPVPPDQLAREAIHRVYGRAATPGEHGAAVSYLLAGDSPDGAGVRNVSLICAMCC